MSEIIKTEAVVLNKIDYRDTSVIASLYTEDFGKISVIVKGGRSSKSKTGRIVDPLNHLQIILYKKETRDIQLLSDAEIISHFARLKENLSALKYSYAVIELVHKLTPVDEQNKKTFKGILRILSLLEKGEEKPEVLFGKFFLFLMKETGYEIQLEKCSVCGRSALNNMVCGFNWDTGILCVNCKEEKVDNYRIKPELFDYLNCLKTSKLTPAVSDSIINDANEFFETYLKFHVPGFKEIQSFKSF
jgi:DNA repair protein RecO (recombination protein O)